MSTKKKIILVIGIVLAVIIIIVLIPKGKTPSKYDQFAKTLKDDGAMFYGAFWCPHCQAQKKEFGSAVKYLPYVECSKADRSQTQVCADKKIEGYPVWTFKDGISLVSDKEPYICEITSSTEPEICKFRSSIYERVWLFPDYKFSIKSPTDPVKESNIWKFPADAQATGEIPLSFLAEQIQFILPE